jgi:hypothetical protein
VGDSVLIEVLDAAGNVLRNSDGIAVLINGVIGSSRYVAWDRSGKQRLNVTAWKEHTSDSRQQVVEVQPAKTGAALYRTLMRRVEDQPTALLFSATPYWQQEVKRSLVLQDKSSLVVPAPDDTNIVVQGRAQIGASRATPTFEWDFGDATKLSTDNPSVVHDYLVALDPNQVLNNFTVTLTVRHPDSTPVVLRRTVVVVNHYALAKKYGFCQPHTSVNSNATTGLTRLGTAVFNGSMRVWNPEPFAVPLTSNQVEVFFADPDKEPVLLPAVSVNYSLHPKLSTIVSCQVEMAKLPPDAVSYAVHFRGRTIHDQPVHVSAYLDIPRRWVNAGLGIQPNFRARFSQVAKRFSNPRTILASELQNLDAIDPVVLGRLPTRGLSVSPTPMGGHTPPLPPIEGAPCDPTNLPDNIPEGFACQATGSINPVEIPGRFMNAKKGNVVLSPGGTTPIARLLQNVSPPQLYSHSGMMTRNLDEITHSTASEDRFADYLVNSGLDGFRPDVLKYGWPGVITQSVEASVVGEPFQDPESGKSYTLQGFDPDQVNVGSLGSVFTYPVVVKPPPDQEASVSQKLKQVANFAVKQAGKSHYRFFCYTNPAIADAATAPAEAGWAVNTYPTVCSSFVWHCVRQVSVSLEGGELEAGVDDEWQVSPGAPDGLYLYTAAERLAAAKVLYDILHGGAEKAGEESLSGLKGFIADLFGLVDEAAIAVANQMLNSFATDWSDKEATGSDQWQNTVDANAVSPEDILHWDSPAKGGLYGYFEQLVYRPRRYESVPETRWVKVQLRGAISGTVLFKGVPVHNAEVLLYEGMSQVTDIHGKFTLNGVPVGTYYPRVSKVLTGPDIASTDPLYGYRLNNDADLLKVDVTANAVKNISVALKGPNESYRSVIVDGTLLCSGAVAATLQKGPAGYYDTGGAPYREWSYPLYKVYRLCPDTPTADYTYVGFAYSVRSEFHIHLELENNNAVKVTFTLTLFEGPAQSDDVAASVSRAFTVNQDGTGTWDGMSCNWGHYDCNVGFSVHNALQST